MMKQSFLFILLFAAGALRAQSTFPILNDLEGTWYQEGRELATYSEWRLVDDHTWGYQVYSIKCDVVTQLSYAVLHLEPTGATLTWQADSVHTGSTQIFRLLRADADALAFQNENTAAQLQQLVWSFSKHGYLSFRADDQQINFQRSVNSVWKTNVVVRLGANVTTLNNFASAWSKYSYRPGLGTDLSVSIGMRGKGPLGVNLVLGLNRRQIGVNVEGPVANVPYSRVGNYWNTDFFVAFIPELELGKQRRLALSAGVSGTFVRRYLLWEVNKTSLTDPYKPAGTPFFYPGHETSIVAGLDWKLPKTFLPALQPALYCRGSWGLGYAKMRTVSVGMGVHLK